MTQPTTRSWAEIRGDFPVLAQEIHGRPLAYLDSAASSQMPRQVLDAMVHYQTTTHANVHRGVHTLSQRATDLFEQAREDIRRFINASAIEECIFVSGATEGVNLVAYAWGLDTLREGDEILISELEHHANMVPWQLIAKRTGAVVRPIPMTERGELDMAAYRALLQDSSRVKLVGVVHVSNALGTINPVEEITRLAHERGALVMIDGCQAAPHLPVDVQAIGCDFYTFSAHKMCGPTGIGVLWGRRELLEGMSPFMGGGDMIDVVSFEGTTFNALPHKLEAGTPPIMQGVGFGAAIRYLEAIGKPRIAAREAELLAYATEAISAIEGVRIWGTAAHKAAVLSFDIEGIHPTDIGTILDTHGVAIRTGHHCAQPIMRRLGIPATARASFAFYNDASDIEALVEGLRLVKDIFGV